MQLFMINTVFRVLLNQPVNKHSKILRDLSGTCCTVDVRFGRYLSTIRRHIYYNIFKSQKPVSTVCHLLMCSRTNNTIQDVDPAYNLDTNKFGIGVREECCQNTELNSLTRLSQRNPKLCIVLNITVFRCVSTRINLAGFV